MPNLKPTYQYTSRMIRLEKQLIAGIQRALAEFRRDSLDALYSSKVNHELIRQITTFIERMTDKIKLLQSAILQPLDETALWYMNQQLGLLRAVGEKRLPNIQQLNLSTYLKRMDAYELLKVPPAWITTMKKNMELNLTRGMISKTDTTSLVERLFAVSVQDGRASVARLAGVAAETEVKSNIWTASILSMFALYDETKNQTGTIYSKQAIAAIDSKTTDCCLQVHGQIQPLDKPFHLTGTPRFADYVDSPPFHWNAILSGEKCITAKGVKNIEDVEIGDYVLTHKNRFMPVTMALSRKHTGKALEIKTDYGIIKVTQEHPILTDNGWKRAEVLRKGDIIFGSNILDVFSSGWPNIISMLDNNSSCFKANGFNKFIPSLFRLTTRAMTAAINFKAKIMGWKVKIYNIFSNWLLKFKINTLLDSNRGKPVDKTGLDFSWIVPVCLCTTNGLFFSNTSFMNGIIVNHSLGGNRINNSNSRMFISAPPTIKRFVNPASFNAGFSKPSFYNIARNAHFFSNSPLRDSKLIFPNNKIGINRDSFRHDKLLQKHYTIKDITALELQNTIVCDLSVAGDESYCINGHFVHNCRTAEALYTESMEEKGTTTRQMKDAADAELTARAITGKRQIIWPSHATSRRGG